MEDGVSNLSSEVMPCRTQDVLAMAKARPQALPKAVQLPQAALDVEARWRQPLALEEHMGPRPRAGHTAVLQVPVMKGETPSVPRRP